MTVRVLKPLDPTIDPPTFTTQVRGETLALFGVRIYRRSHYSGSWQDTGYTLIGMGGCFVARDLLGSTIGRGYTDRKSALVAIGTRFNLHEVA